MQSLKMRFREESIHQIPIIYYLICFCIFLWVIAVFMLFYEFGLLDGFHYIRFWTGTFLFPITLFPVSMAILFVPIKYFYLLTNDKKYRSIRTAAYSISICIGILGGIFEKLGALAPWELSPAQNDVVVFGKAATTLDEITVSSTLTKNFLADGWIDGIKHHNTDLDLAGIARCYASEVLEQIQSKRNRF